MAKIIILREGQRKAFEVTNTQLEDISKNVNEARLAGKVRIIKLMNPKIEFMTSDYKGAEYDAPDKGEDAMKAKAREWHDKRRIYAKKPAEEKTKLFMEKTFPLFKSVVPELTPEQVKDIESRTLKFFTDNPKRCYPNGEVFMLEYSKRSIGRWDNAKLRILENLLIEDVSAVKSDEQYNTKVLGIQEEMRMKPELKAVLDPRVPSRDEDEISEKQLDEIF